MQVPGDTRSQENFPFTSSASGGTRRLLPTPIQEKKTENKWKIILSSVRIYQKKEENTT